MRLRFLVLLLPLGSIQALSVPRHVKREGRQASDAIPKQRSQLLMTRFQHDSFFAEFPLEATERARNDPLNFHELHHGAISYISYTDEDGLGDLHLDYPLLTSTPPIFTPKPLIRDLPTTKSDKPQDYVSSLREFSVGRTRRKEKPSESIREPERLRMRQTPFSNERVFRVPGTVLGLSSPVPLFSTETMMVPQYPLAISSLTDVDLDISQTTLKSAASPTKANANLEERSCTDPIDDGSLDNDIEMKSIVRSSPIVVSKNDFLERASPRVGETTISLGRSNPWQTEKLRSSGRIIDMVKKKKGPAAIIAEKSKNHLLQGGSLLTWSFGNPAVERIHVALKTEGRPLNADVAIWQGPNNAPHKMRVYTEDGSLRPFSAVIESPRGPNTISIRNTGQLEFPLTAHVMAEDRRTARFLHTAKSNELKHKAQTIQGGALRTYPFDAAVENVQLLLTTEGLPLSVSIELLQGPENSKQMVEVDIEDGLDRPFFMILETPGSGNVVRVVNQATVEFPLTAQVEPYMVGDIAVCIEPVMGGDDARVVRPW